jgi:two-component system sensor histidine kinase/response regulator
MDRPKPHLPLGRLGVFRLLALTVIPLGLFGTLLLLWANHLATQTPAELTPHELAQRVFLMAVGFLLVSSASHYLFLNRFVLSPLAKLAQTAKRMREGDYSRILQGTGCREILELGETFHELVETIREELREREAAEQRLLKTNFLAETALQLTKAGPWHVPVDGRLFYISSERAAAILGDPPRPGRHYHIESEWLAHIEAADPEIAAQVRENFFAALSGKSTLYDAIYPYKRPSDGSIVWVHSVGLVVRNERGIPTDMYGVSQDITDSKLAALELASAKQAAETANQAKSLFLATMSHEIRTPMNAVINMAQLTLDTQLTNRQRQYVSVVNISARNLLSLINDILDFSKIEAGKMELETELFSLQRLLDEITESFRGRVLEKGIDFIVHADADVPDQLIGDSLRLRQILLNLVGNAFKFTEEGEVVLRVQKAELLPSHSPPRGPDAPDPDAPPPTPVSDLLFFVRDSGIGIHQGQQAKLFTAFSQVDNSTSRKYGGSGLGLAISKRLVEMMGGRIWVESELGRGATFLFTARFGLSPASAAQTTSPPFPDFAHLRVLVVDEKPSSRELLRSLLERFGMHCQLAQSGTEAIALLEAASRSGSNPKPFDLVLLDWSTPGLEGLKLAAAISRVPEHPRIPIILLNTFATREEDSRIDNLGVRAVLPKPVTASSLFDATAEIFCRPLKGKLYSSGFDDSDISPEDFHGLSLLLAEDNEANQFVAQELLSAAGVQVDIASNGLEALHKLERRNDYACILMDMQMPKMDGITATREIRKRWPQLRIPIIALTANAMKSDEEACLLAGMDDFLSKPINRTELFRVLHRWADPPAGDPASLPSPLAPPSPPLPPARLSPIAASPAANLYGIDLPDAMRRLGLPWSALERIFLSFADSQPQTFRDLQDALRAGNTEAARRHAHSIAGAAGSLSAHELQARAKALETAIKSESPEQDLLFKRLEDELQHVLDSLSQLRPPPSPTDPAPTTSTPPSHATPDPAQLPLFQKQLRLLLEPLQLGDVDEIQKRLASCLAEGVPAPLLPQFQQLITLTEDFSYPEAIQLVHDLLARSA